MRTETQTESGEFVEVRDLKTNRKRNRKKKKERTEKKFEIRLKYDTQNESANINWCAKWAGPREMKVSKNAMRDN